MTIVKTHPSLMCLPSLTTTVWITTVSLHIASNLSILNSKPQKFKFSIFRMSNWNSSDLEAEDYDPNKDYSVQVQRKDGGLASTQVMKFMKFQHIFICFIEMLAKNCRIRRAWSPDCSRITSSTRSIRKN